MVWWGSGDSMENLWYGMGWRLGRHVGRHHPPSECGHVESPGECGRVESDEDPQLRTELAQLYDRCASTAEESINEALRTGLLDGLPKPRHDSASRAWRNCRIAQSTVESLRRCRDARAVDRCLRDLDVTVILAGSLMYGRFWSVLQRRAARPSDLDLVIVVRDRRQWSAVLARLAAQPFLDGDQAEEAERFFAHCGDDIAAAGLAECMAVIQCWGDRPDEISQRWGSASRYELSVHICAREDFIRYILPSGAGGTPIGRTFRTVPIGMRRRGKLHQEIWSSYTGGVLVDIVRGIPLWGGAVESRQPFVLVDGLPYVGRFLRSILPRLEVLTLSDADEPLLRQCATEIADLRDRASAVAHRQVGYDEIHPHRLEFAPRTVSECRTLERPQVRRSELTAGP